MRTHTLPIFLTAALALAGPADAQSPQTTATLHGSVAVSILVPPDMNEGGRVACDSDNTDTERRIQFILNQTRLLPFIGFERRVVDNHPEFRRLLAAREAEMQALPPAVRSMPERLADALERASRPIIPWENPLTLLVNTITQPGGLGCVQSINFVVSVWVQPRRILSGQAPPPWTMSVPVFQTNALLHGPTPTARANRNRVIEDITRDFANAWAEANR
jgi:hypothetical protein